MKKFMLAAAMLLATHFGTQASVFVVNGSPCDVIVTEVCYDVSCSVVSSVAYAVRAGFNINITPACPPGPYQTAYTVCWVGAGCAGSPCATVGGSLPPPPCAPVTHATLLGCSACTPGMSGAFMNVDFTVMPPPATGYTLTILP